MLIQTHREADETSSAECVGRTAALSEQVEGHMAVRAGNAENFQTVLTEMSYLSVNNLMNREERENPQKQIQKIQIPLKCMLTCYIVHWMLVPPARPAQKRARFSCRSWCFQHFHGIISNQL